MTPLTHVRVVEYGDWTCDHCGELGAACGCEAAEVCPHCREYWRYCSCWISDQGENMRRNENGALRIYTIFDNPKDVPGCVVVRAGAVQPDGSLAWDQGAIAFKFATPEENELAIDSARRHCMHLGLVMVPRHPGDQPHIVETWM